MSERKAKERVFRSYEIERDAGGMPCKLWWRGDFKIPPKPTREEIDREKLRVWEATYGKRGG